MRVETRGDVLSLMRLALTNAVYANRRLEGTTGWHWRMQAPLLAAAVVVATAISLTLAIGLESWLDLWGIWTLPTMLIGWWIQRIRQKERWQRARAEYSRLYRDAASMLRTWHEMVEIPDNWLPSLASMYTKLEAERLIEESPDLKLLEEAQALAERQVSRFASLELPAKSAGTT